MIDVFRTLLGFELFPADKTISASKMFVKPFVSVTESAMFKKVFKLVFFWLVKGDLETLETCDQSLLNYRDLKGLTPLHKVNKIKGSSRTLSSSFQKLHCYSHEYFLYVFYIFKYCLYIKNFTILSLKQVFFSTLQ